MGQNQCLPLYEAIEKRESTEKIQTAINKLFQIFDYNKNGVLEREEVDSLFSSLYEYLQKRDKHQIAWKGTKEEIFTAW